MNLMLSDYSSKCKDLHYDAESSSSIKTTF